MTVFHHQELKFPIGSVGKRLFEFLLVIAIVGICCLVKKEPSDIIYLVDNVLLFLLQLRAFVAHQNKGLSKFAIKEM